MGGRKESSPEVGRNLLHNNTGNNTVNKKEPTLKKEEPVWITFEDWFWSWVVTQVFGEAEYRRLVEQRKLPVIKF
jgi:hypothetical protein